jgi:hypothetical protein
MDLFFVWGLVVYGISIFMFTRVIVWKVNEVISYYHDKTIEPRCHKYGLSASASALPYVHIVALASQERYHVSSYSYSYCYWFTSSSSSTQAYS